MRPLRGMVALFGLAVVVASCVAPAAAQDPSVNPEATLSAAAAEPELPVAPVDPDLTPVSLSHLSVAAKAAFDLCVLPDQAPAVVGMALLPSARDVRKYMLTNGNEPELQDDVPVWVVQLKGPVTYRFGTVFHPLCVVKGGERFVFAPYGGEGRDGRWAPPDTFTPPQFALPPLAP